MLTAIKTFFAPYIGWIIGGGIALVVGAFSWITVDLALTKSALQRTETKLEASEQIIAAQARGLQAVNRVDELERRINRVLRNSERLIMETEGANHALPEDVTAIWRATDDSLRAQRNDHSGSAEGLPNP